MSGQTNLSFGSLPSAEKDIFLCHNGADKPWVEMVTQRIEQQPFRNRNLAAVFDKWDFGKGSNIVLDMEKFLDTARFVGVVVSRAMLSAEWPNWSEPSRFGLTLREHAVA